MAVKGEDLALAVADAFEQAVAAVADMVVQGNEQKARVSTDRAHPVVIERQNSVGAGAGAGQKGLGIGRGPQYGQAVT